MLTPKPSSRFISLTLTLLLLLGFFTSAIASEAITDEEDLEGFEELLAVDEEEDKLEGTQVKSSETEALTKAQRIVIQLNNENTKRIIDSNEFVLVLGFAPWCARSAELMPHFAEAAMALKEMGSPVLMAKLDAERYPKAAGVVGIKGFPTLLLFVNGTSHMYNGGFTAEDIIIWARKKTGVPIIRINSVAEAEGFVAKHKMFVIGLFEKFEGSNYEEFTKAAVTDNEIQFAEASNTKVAQVLFPDIKAENVFLGLVKSEAERYVKFEDAFQQEKILEFLQYNKHPLVTELTQLNSVRVYSSPVKLQVLVFSESDEFKSLLSPLQAVARKFKSKIMFIYIDVAEDDLSKPFLTLFGLEESDKTVVAAFDNKNSFKYLLESDPTPSNIEEFCSRLLQGALPQYFKSQDIPDNNGTVVQVVVGRTFDDIVLGNSLNVLLEVYTPWCMNCETTSKQVEKLAKHFKGLDNLIIARIDASSNEHPKLQVDEFPTLLFYPFSDKSNPVNLPTKSSLKDLAAFIRKNVRAAEDRGVPPNDKTTKDEL